jgi:hypothetical protein
MNLLALQSMVIFKQSQTGGAGEQLTLGGNIIQAANTPTWSARAQRLVSDNSPVLYQSAHLTI